MHTRDARDHGETQRRIDLVAAWHETDLFTEAECAVLALTESLTRISQTQNVPDEVYEPVTKHFNEQQTAALIMAICVINSWNRMNVAARTPLPPQ